MTTIEPDSIVVVEPSGKFQLIDVPTGGIRIEQSLSLTAAPKSIYTLVSDDQLFVCFGGALRRQASLSIGIADYPLVDGQVYAFDLRDGRPLWPGPAIVEQRGIALAQPSDIPILVFVDRQSKRDASGQSNNARLLCLDKATGGNCLPQ